MNLSDAFDDLLSPLPPVAPLSQEVVVRGRRRRRAKLAALGGSGAAATAGVLALVLAGGTAPATDRVVAGPTPSAPATPSPGPRVATPRLVLEPDGLGYVAGEASIRHLPFASTPAAQVEDLLEQALGKGTTSALPDCGPAITVVQYPGFALYLDAGQPVGWVDRGLGSGEDARLLTDAQGIGIGSSVADLRAAATSLVINQGSTIGTEFSIDGGFAGLLTGTADRDRVTQIGIGQRCVFR